MATIGIESIIESTSPVTRFVAPGPEVAQQTPTLPCGPRIAFRRETGVLLVPHQHMPDRVIVQSVVQEAA